MLCGRARTGRARRTAAGVDRVAAVWGVVAAVVLAPGLVGGTSVAGGQYTTQEDIEASELAVKRAGEFCADVDLSDIDYEVGREELEAGVGDSNFILDALKRSNSTEEFSEELAKEMTPFRGATTLGTLVMAFLIGIVWWYTCWTACPCCRKCRVLERAHTRSFLFKVGVLVVLILLFIAMACAGFYAYYGKNKIRDGMESVGCTAARVLNYTVNGNAEQNFIGMLPMLNEFGNLKGILDDGSDFINQLTAIMDNTAEVERATFVAAQATGLLQSVLAQSTNMNPTPTGPSYQSDANMHKCVLCEELGPLLTPVKTELENGVASALANARAEVDTQLSAESRAALRDSFDASITPLTEAKNMVRNNTEVFLSDDFNDIKELVILTGEYAFNAISICVFGIGLCAFLSGACCVAREEIPVETESNGREKSNPVNPWIHRCACQTWCWGFMYAFWVFFISGMMIVFAVPASSLCLVMDDIDSQLLLDIAPGLGIDFEPGSDDFTMMSQMIDTCFSRVTPDTNKSLMDIIFIVENGTVVTIKEKIQGQTTDLINAQFENVNIMLGQSQPNLMDSPQLASLLSFLAKPVDAYIMSEATTMSGDSRFQGVALDSRSNNLPQAGLGVDMAFATSIACSDEVVSGAGTAFGLDSFKAKLLDFTSTGQQSSTPSSQCTVNVACNRNPNTGSAMNCPSATAECQACEAANKIMNLKAEVVNGNSYRCDTFQTGTGADCDLKDMVKNAAGEYVNDCVEYQANGDLKLTVKAKTCNLATFKQYVSDWNSRLSKAYTRVDEAVPQTTTGIQVDLQNLVTQFVTAPVNNMVDQAQGNFLKQEYGDLVDGMCYKGVRGLRMVARAYYANAIFTCLLILVSYGLWRHGIDNYNLWYSNNAKVVDGSYDAEMGPPKSVVPVPAPVPATGNEEVREIEIK